MPDVDLDAALSTTPDMTAELYKNVPFDATGSTTPDLTADLLLHVLMTATGSVTPDATFTMTSQSPLSSGVGVDTSDPSTFAGMMQRPVMKAILTNFPVPSVP